MPFGVRWPFGRDQQATDQDEVPAATADVAAVPAANPESRPASEVSPLLRTADDGGAATTPAPAPRPRDDSPAEPDPGLRSAVLERTTSQTAMLPRDGGVQSTLVSVPETNRWANRIENRALYQDLEGATSLHRNEQTAHFADGLQSLLSFKQADEMDLGGPFSGVFRLLAPQSEDTDKSDDSAPMNPFAPKRSKGPEKPAPRPAIDVRVGRGVVDPSLELHDGRWSERPVTPAAPAVAVQRKAGADHSTTSQAGASASPPDDAVTAALQRATAPTPAPAQPSAAFTSEATPYSGGQTVAARPSFAAERNEETFRPLTGSAPGEANTPSPAEGSISPRPATPPQSPHSEQVIERVTAVPQPAPKAEDASAPLVMTALNSPTPEVDGPAATSTGPVFRSTTASEPTAPADATRRALDAATAPLRNTPPPTRPRQPGAPFVARSVPTGTPETPAVTPQPVDAPASSPTRDTARVFRTPATEAAPPTNASQSASGGPERTPQTVPHEARRRAIIEEAPTEPTTEPSGDAAAAALTVPLSEPGPATVPVSGVSPLEATTAPPLAPAEMPLATSAGTGGDDLEADASALISRAVASDVGSSAPPAQPGISGTAATAETPTQSDSSTGLGPDVPFGTDATPIVSPRETQATESQYAPLPFELRPPTATAEPAPNSAADLVMRATSTAEPSAPTESSALASDAGRVDNAKSSGKTAPPAETPRASDNIERTAASPRAADGAPASADTAQIPQSIARTPDTSRTAESPAATPATSPGPANPTATSPTSPEMTVDSGYQPLEMSLATPVQTSEESATPAAGMLQRAASTPGHDGSTAITDRPLSKSADGVSAADVTEPTANAATPVTGTSSNASARTAPISGADPAGYTPVALELARPGTGNGTEQTPAGLPHESGRPSLISRLLDRVTGRSAAPTQPATTPPQRAQSNDAADPTRAAGVSATALPAAAVTPSTPSVPDAFATLPFASEISAPSWLERDTQTGDLAPNGESRSTESPSTTDTVQASHDAPASPISGAAEFTANAAPFERAPVTPSQPLPVPETVLPFAEEGSAKPATEAEPGRATAPTNVLRSAEESRTPRGGEAPLHSEPRATHPSNREPAATVPTPSTPSIPAAALPFAQVPGNTHPVPGRIAATGEPVVFRAAAVPQAEAGRHNAGASSERPFATPGGRDAGDPVAASGPPHTGATSMAAGSATPIIARLTETETSGPLDDTLPLVNSPLMNDFREPGAQGTHAAVSPHETPGGMHAGVAQRLPSVEQPLVRPQRVEHDGDGAPVSVTSHAPGAVGVGVPTLAQRSPVKRTLVKPHQAQHAGHEASAAAPTGPAAFVQRTTDGGHSHDSDPFHDSMTTIDTGDAATFGTSLPMVSQQPSLYSSQMTMLTTGPAPTSTDTLQRTIEPQSGASPAADMPLVSPTSSSIFRESAGPELQRSSQPEALAQIHRDIEINPEDVQTNTEMLPHELDILTEHIWQRVRRKLRIERERSRGWI